MSNSYFKVVVDATPISSTSIFTLGSFDLNALPGGGLGTSNTSLIVSSVVWMITDGDHSSRCWQRSSLLSNNPAGFNLKGSVNANSGTLGIIGDADLSTIAFDTSGTSWRCRVTPSTASATTWFAIHTVQLVKYS